MGWQKDRETEGKGVLNRLKCSKGAPNVFQTAVIEFRESLSGFLCVRVRVYACVYVCVYLRVWKRGKDSTCDFYSVSIPNDIFACIAA